MRVDFSLLACLEAVVTEGSFEKAASLLAITQSAVSQRIRQLETQAGLPLLFRTRPVRPTPAAQGGCGAQARAQARGRRPA